MKKWMSVLLALCLIALLGAGALAAPGDAVLVYEGMEGFDEQVQSMAYADGTLYILGYNSLYTYADGALTQWQLDTSTVEATEEDDVYFNLDPSAIVTDGGEIRLMGMERGYDMEAEESLVGGGGLYSISLEEADGIKTARVELATELDFEAMIEDSGDEYTWMNISMPFVQDGMLVGTTYGVNNIFWFDLEDGSYHSFSNEYLGLLAPYKEGRVLALQVDYNAAEPRVELCALEMESEGVEVLCEMPMESYNAPSMLYYDAQADLLYYVLNGELWRMPLTDPAAAESVADMPLNYSGQAQPVLTEDGYFIVADYETVVRRNTDPSQRAQTRIVVQDAYAIDRAYYAFTGANPDVEVVKKTSDEDLIQAMMSQSASMDIYVLDMSGAEFATLLDRGYAVELGGSEKIASLVGQMYPAIAEAASRDGMVYALPLEMYNYSMMGYDMEAFRRLGLSEEDVPTTWDELLDLLIALPDYMANDEDVSMFEPHVTQEDARESLFSMILDNYLLYIDQPDQEFTLDTPLLRGLLEKLEMVDFEALGLISRDEAGTSFFWSAEPGDFMFTTTVNLDVRRYAFDNFTPMLLGFEEGVPGMMSVQVNAALVNPFSPNVETAIAFLETVADNLDEIFRIQTMPSENTPVRSPYYEENMESYEEQLAYLRESLESAEDEETRATYEQRIAETEENMREYEEESSWDVSAASIDNYRGYAENMVVPSNMNDAEFYELRMQYVDGLIGMDEMISKMDQRLTMMRMEGY